MLWDIFCKVIDNHGDIGVCWRLAAELAARGEEVRLWIDDATALGWMAPGRHDRVTLVKWEEPAPLARPGEVVIEAFGCDPPGTFLTELARATARDGRQPAWINLEYLSAEPYVERSHRLPSPVLHGPARGLTKHFFYPGFTQATGGLIREQDFAQRRARVDRPAWLARAGVHMEEHTTYMSLFCYEPAALAELLSQLARGPGRTTLLVTEGRPRAAVQRLLPNTHRHGKLSLHFLPFVTQVEYDHLLWSCDLNFVRGEDSLVRAIWARKPFVWQAYPQEDGAHAAKLHAFVDWLNPPDALRRFHSVWNGLADIALPHPDAQAWAPAAELAARRAEALPELVGGLIAFARELRAASP
ncbi:MAG TPA: elongation factor P maturation arginine rhamnosyltransferase EarP [Ramlibacter sp.]|uniref:elongation factor P maturation arginine rhamnosyltransferase EarP n=1 Tax=Ramlibacter sp. TaxID=1917967 RepID=UPI002BBA91C4|nr:elongation factor P maturation arginine rhamnosyltransferase EarP [Ramlibacter sp.]HVZ44422.1 elongation factor P maturation arginine rhamnosyltransferase EarP [Ramlibacter sp.]